MRKEPFKNPRGHSPMEFIARTVNDHKGENIAFSLSRLALMEFLLSKPKLHAIFDEDNEGEHSNDVAISLTKSEDHALMFSFDKENRRFLLEYVNIEGLDYIFPESVDVVYTIEQE